VSKAVELARRGGSAAFDEAGSAHALRIGCGAARKPNNGFRETFRSAAMSRSKPNEGISSFRPAVPLNQATREEALVEWGGGTRRKTGSPLRAAVRGHRRSAFSTTGDVRGRKLEFGSLSRRAQRVCSQREFSDLVQHDGTSAGKPPSYAPSFVAEAVAAKNRGILSRKRQRELHAPAKAIDAA